MGRWFCDDGMGKLVVGYDGQYVYLVDQTGKHDGSFDILYALTSRVLNGL